MISDKLKKMGGPEFHVPLENVYTSAYVTGQYLKSKVMLDDTTTSRTQGMSEKKVYVVGE